MKENFNFREISFDGINYIYPTAAVEDDILFGVAQEIISSGKEFDAIIPLLAGACTGVRKMSDNLGDIDENGEFKALKVIPIKVSSYKEFGVKGEPKLEKPFILPKKAKRLLIFDDVADSGETLVFTKEELIKRGAEEVTTATLFYKDKRSAIAPDFFGATTDSWIIFDHEVKEFTYQFYARYFREGMEFGEIRSHLLDIGLPMKKVDYFLPRAVAKIK